MKNACRANKDAALWPANSSRCGCRRGDPGCSGGIDPHLGAAALLYFIRRLVRDEEPTPRTSSRKPG